MDSKNNFPEKENNQKEIFNTPPKLITPENNNKNENIQNTSPTIQTSNNNEIKTDDNIINDEDSKDDINNLSRLSQIIKQRNEISNSIPYILKSKFNLWKNLTFIKEETIERRTKKLLIKKTLNIRKGNTQQEQIEKEKRKTLKILKPTIPIKSNEEIKKKKKNWLICKQKRNIKQIL